MFAIVDADIMWAIAIINERITRYIHNKWLDLLDDFGRMVIIFYRHKIDDLSSYSGTQFDVLRNYGTAPSSDDDFMALWLVPLKIKQA
jgi:hypothetical protein